MKNTGVIAGNFDVIHPGYIHLFNECKEFCTELIILLHEDPSIERPEKLKPILNLDERMIILSSLKQIDQIIPYKLETDLYELLSNLDIDIRFLGDDYKSKPFTGDDLNTQIYYHNRNHNFSSTNLRNKIINNK